MRTTLRPTYFTQFQCIGGNCEDTCCGGWTIHIDQQAFNSYITNKNPSLSQKFKENILENENSKGENDYGKLDLTNRLCPFLTEQGMCGIHQQLGEESLCNSCKNYPRINNLIGNQVERSLTLSCPEATRIILNSESGIDFEIIEDTNHYDLKKWIDMDSAQLVFLIRAICIDILQNRNNTIEGRLTILGYFLEELISVENKELGSFLEKYQIEMNNMKLDLKSNFSDKVYKIKLINDYFQNILSLSLTTNRYKEISKKFSVILEQADNTAFWEDNYDEMEQEYERYIEQYGYQLENYLVNIIYQNIFPFDQNNVIESYYLLLFRFTIIKTKLLALGISGEILVDDVVMTVQTFSRLFEHDNNLLKSLYTKIYSESSNMTTNIRRMII